MAGGPGTNWALWERAPCPICGAEILRKKRTGFERFAGYPAEYAPCRTCAALARQRGCEHGYLNCSACSHCDRFDQQCTIRQRVDD